MKKKHERVVALYKEGTTIDQIMKDVGYKSTNTIYGILHDNDIPLRRDLATTQDVETAIKLYKQGTTIDQIHKLTGVSVTCLYKNLRRRGIKFRQK